MATSYKGNTEIRETHESGTLTRAAKDSLELTKTGKYTALEAVQPAKGDELVAGYTVVQSILSSKRGGMGTLVIQLIEKDTSTQFLPFGAIESTIEIDMSQVEKPITGNPKLVTQDSGTTQTVIDEVAAWRNSPQQRRRNYQIPLSTLTREASADNDDEWVDLAGESLAVAQKIAAGIEAWIAFYPVVTRTSTYKSRPDPSAYGKIQSPPVTVPGSWSWLKTADRIVQTASKQYQRIEQWTASDQWDTDLYESG